MVRCPYVVRTTRTYCSSIMLGMASSVANEVIMIIAGLWRYGDWRHVATCCNAVVYCKREKCAVCCFLFMFAIYCFLTTAMSCCSLCQRIRDNSKLFSMQFQSTSPNGVVIASVQYLPDTCYVLDPLPTSLFSAVFDIITPFPASLFNHHHHHNRFTVIFPGPPG